MTREPQPSPDSRAERSPLPRVIAAWIVLPLFFLLTGGTLAWWQAWAYCGVLLVPMTVFVVHMARHDPDFIARRFQVREKEAAQRRILAWGYPPMIAGLILPGIDHRCGWSAVPVAVVVAALALALAGYLAVLRVFLENRWAGRTVETYSDQKVISTGPYAIVRHPMYSGTTLLYLATPIALGSWWAVLPMLLFVPILVLRIRNEEEVLVRELPGYDDYRRRVRHRMVPLLW